MMHNSSNGYTLHKVEITVIAVSVDDSHCFIAFHFYDAYSNLKIFVICKAFANICHEFHNTVHNIVSISCF